MKSFTLPASTIGNLSACLTRLLPEATAKAIGGDAIAANRVSQKIKRKLEEANAPFMDELRKTYEAKNAVVKKYQDEIEAKRTEGASDEDIQKLGAELTPKMRKETDAIQAQSQSEELGKKDVTVTLSDEERKHLRTLLAATTAFWAGMQGESYQDDFLRAADAIEGAKEPGDEVVE